MRKLFRKILFKFYRPYCVWVVSRDRTYTYNGLTLNVPKGIFHPGLFFSTGFLAEELLKLNLKDKKFIEVGCGSGLLSLIAARAGAVVTAIDINPDAVKATATNASRNNITLQAIESNLFDNIGDKKFDIVAINPPYFKKHPTTAESAAWNAGTGYQYFEKLFEGMHKHLNPYSTVLMVTSEDVDIDLINQIAARNNFALNLYAQRIIMLERNYIYAITPAL